MGQRRKAIGLGLNHAEAAIAEFVRRITNDEPGAETVLCVNNMSRFPQPVELDLSAWQGSHPHELTGGVPFPKIGELPYLLTLPGHGFYWFSITPPEDNS